MNCRLCWGYIREKNSCPGCLTPNAQESKKSQYRALCTIKNCEYFTSGKVKYCSDNCDRFPCVRLKQLDKRYRTKYKMSMIENLKMINDLGIRKFISNEKERWKCPECGDLICMHKPACLTCGHTWNQG